MIVSKNELLKTITTIADQEHINVTLEQTSKGSVICGIIVFICGLIFGPIGLLIGGIVGGLIGYYITYGTFKPLGEVLRNLSKAEQNQIVKEVMSVAESKFQLHKISDVIFGLLEVEPQKRAIIQKVQSVVSDQLKKSDVSWQTPSMITYVKNGAYVLLGASGCFLYKEISNENSPMIMPSLAVTTGALSVAGYTTYKDGGLQRVSEEDFNARGRSSSWKDALKDTVKSIVNNPIVKAVSLVSAGVVGCLLTKPAISDGNPENKNSLLSNVIEASGYIIGTLRNFIKF